MVSGDTLGPYRILGKLGEGGMGEVYRARDGALHRDVALKVLPEAFASDADRLARFRREAHVLAALNHPNIAAIYGFEESTAVHALVLELVEGPTLADRIAQGAIPIDETLPIARQIAEALEAAHEQGIIHRDLKPANIKVRPDGTVKVLDFGLAKALSPAGSEDPAYVPRVGRDFSPAGSKDPAYVHASQSPTITSPAMMTGMGTILGTAAYMSPEQAKGRAADKRSDIWAFGCVVYEMLTGRRAFDGDDPTLIMARVLEREVDFERLPPSVAPRISQVLRLCLRKDPKERVADIRDVRLALEGAFETAVRPDGAPSVAQSGRRLAMVIALSLLAGAGVMTALMWSATRPAPLQVVRTIIAPATTFTTPDSLTITPDGTRVIYRNGNQLLIRAMNELEPSVLRGFTAPRGVFVSPDSRWVGSFDSNAIKKVAVTGGPSVTVCAIQGQPGGATWSEDGTIIFATSSVATGLQRVAAAGGEPTVLTTPDRERGEGDHVSPEFLPNGEAVLFTITAADGAVGNEQIAVLDLRTGASKVLIRGGNHAHYVPTGHLLYGAAGTLRAVGFDLRRLEVVGAPVTVLTDVLTNFRGFSDIGVANNGSLVYFLAASRSDQQAVVSVERQGRVSMISGLMLDSYRDVRVSPNGAHLALTTQNDIWTYDVARARLSRLTTDPAPDHSPLWTPDAQRIIFTSRRAGFPEIFWRPADGTGSDERLLSRTHDLLDLRANGWSADGGQLLFSELPTGGQCALAQMAVERPGDVTVLIKSESCSDYSAVSPDGRWMAYESRASGRTEIYVERYPELGSRQQISTGGGRMPLWSRDGQELFFASLDRRQMLAVPVESRRSLVVGREQVLFEIAMAQTLGGRPYDMGLDNQFVIIRTDEPEAGIGAGAQIVVVQNWFEELKRLVPVN